MESIKLRLFRPRKSGYGDPTAQHFAVNRTTTSNSDDSQSGRPDEPHADNLPTKDSVESPDHIASPLTSQEGLIKLGKEVNQEVKLMQNEFSKRSLSSWLMESVSFESELSKMRWPSILFMAVQVIANLTVSLVLQIDNIATNWIGFQGVLMLILLIFNLLVNLWDTQLRYKELLMKSEQICDLIRRCSEDTHLLNRWRQYNWKSASARKLFAPKSPCIHQTLTYRDNSCLNLPDFLLVRGDIIHLYPGEKAPGDCISLKSANDLYGGQAKDDDESRIVLNEGDIYHPKEVDIDINQRDVDNRRGESTATNVNSSSFELSHARLKKAWHGKDFLMLTTPYIKSLRISLQRSHKRPVNSIEKECFIVSRKYFETYVIPLVFILSTLVTAIHYGYLDLTDEEQKIKTISIAYLLLRPSLTIMPFLPWMFPCFWMVVNAYGSARLLCCAEVQQRKSKEYRKAKATRAADDHWTDGEFGEDSYWQHTSGGQVGSRNPAITTAAGHLSANRFENLLATPTAAGSSDQNKHDENDLHELRNNIKLTRLMAVFVSLVIGKSGHVWRSSSLLQVLGCLTSLCCIDKVGILSWSNPTPEKVFVLTKDVDANNNSRDTSSTKQSHEKSAPLATSAGTTGSATATRLGDPSDQSSKELLGHDCDESDSQAQGLSSSTLDEDRRQAAKDARNSTIFAVRNSSHHSSSRVEVLDVSQAFGTYHRGFNEPIVSEEYATKLQFDDPSWKQYLSNLKPLGLGILLNNCCEQSFGDYFRFYKHISYESTLRSNQTPVVKRRCVCALSELIGFSKNVIKFYNYSNQVGCYKLVDPNQLKKGQLVPVGSSLEQAGRLKLPLPNMICDLHQNTTTGSYQTFSQGTADIILDSCVEYWNGSELAPLDEASRKKIIDFYHRTSLTSYCYAFAYSPLLTGHDLEDYYVELPPDGSRIYSKFKKFAHEQHDNYLQKQVVTLPNSSSDHRQQQRSNFESETLGDHRDLNFSSQENIQLGSSASNSFSPSSPSYFDPQGGDSLPQIQLNSVDRDHEPSRRVRKRKTPQRVERRYLSAEDLPTAVKAHKKLKFNGVIPPKGRKRKAGPVGNQKLIETMEELGDQVFVGMVAMQYQCCPDFVALVEQLEHACIRFVHFSKENELRSRVFSEKMGLESGWNCHISLQSEQDLDKAEKSPISVEKSNKTPLNQQGELSRDSFNPSTRVSNILIGAQNVAKQRSKMQSSASAKEEEEANHRTSCNVSRVSSLSADQMTLYSWRSLPSLVMQIISRVSSSRQTANRADHSQLQPMQPSQQSPGEGVPGASGGSQEALDMGDSGGGTGGRDEEEGFDSLAFDMSNRAKLPKGIENIRPHLETVDNIPLQVSLFTDCTAELAKEMIEIMQDYGEIVCVIGSASSRVNTSIFLQANASIAIEPLAPQSCTQAGRPAVPAHRAKRHRRRRYRRREYSRNRRSADKDRSESELDPVGGKESAAGGDSRRIVLSSRRDRLGIGAAVGQVFEESNMEKSVPVPVPDARFRRHRRSMSESSVSRDHVKSHRRRRRNSSSSSSSGSSESSSYSSSSSSGRSAVGSSSRTNATISTSSSTAFSHSRESFVSGTSFETELRSDSEEADAPRGEEDDKLLSTDGQNTEQHNSDTEHHHGWSKLALEMPEPSSLASKLASLPCSFSYNRRETVNLYSLIMEARHFTSLLFLPPMLSSGLTIWLTTVVVPLMSFSLMYTKMDSQVMKIAVGKNLQLKPENITFFVICYLIKFIPSVIVVVLNFGLIIAHSCKSTGFGSNSLGPCWMFTYVRHVNGTSSNTSSPIVAPGEQASALSESNLIDEDLLWSNHLLTAQVCAAFLMVVYFGKLTERLF